MKTDPPVWVSPNGSPAEPGVSLALGQKQPPGSDPAYARQKDLVRALRQAGRGPEAHRLAQCGQRVEQLDLVTGEIVATRWRHCGYPFCPRCGYRRARKKAWGQRALVLKVHRLNRRHLLTLAGKVPSLRRKALDLEAAVEGFSPTRGHLIREKRTLLGQLRSFLDAVRSLSEEWVDISSAVFWLRKAAGHLQAQGLRGTGDAAASLRLGRQYLEEALDRRMGYGFQALTLTKTTYHEDYREQFKALQRDFRKLLKKLPDLGVGTIAAVHLQNNLNIHALRFGDLLDEARVQQLWQSITGDSDRVKVKTAGDVEGWLCYMYAPSKEVAPEEVISRWLAIHGLHRVSSHGLLGSRCLRRAVRLAAQGHIWGQVGHSNAA